MQKNFYTVSLVLEGSASDSVCNNANEVAEMISEYGKYLNQNNSYIEVCLFDIENEALTSEMTTDEFFDIFTSQEFEENGIKLVSSFKFNF